MPQGIKITISFNWIAGVEGGIDDIEKDDTEYYIDFSVTEDKSSQDDDNDQDLNYDPIPYNVPYSQDNTSANVLDELDDLQEIDEDKLEVSDNPLYDYKNPEQGQINTYQQNHKNCLPQNNLEEPV